MRECAHTSDSSNKPLALSIPQIPFELMSKDYSICASRKLSTEVWLMVLKGFVRIIPQWQATHVMLHNTLCALTRAQ